MKVAGKKIDNIAKKYYNTIQKNRLQLKNKLKNIMKGCFLLQRRFAYLGHHLIQIMQKQYDIQEWCAYVHLRSSYDFLKYQKDVNYTQLILDEDVHKKYKEEQLDIEYLRRFEKEYGIPNLWPFIAPDRIIMSSQLIREYPYDKPGYTHEEMLKILQIKIKTVLDFFEEERPDFIVFAAIGAMAPLLLYHIARKKGIKTLCLTLNFLPNKVVVAERYDYFSPEGIQQDTKNFLSNITPDKWIKAENILKQFNENPQKYSEIHNPKKQKVKYLQQFSFLKPQQLTRSIKWFLYLIYRHFTSIERHDYSYINPWHYLIDRLKRALRNIAPVIYDPYKPDDDFIFFPLQFEPEISLLLLAPFMADQLYIIKQIAQSLPVGMFLYVKEHPHMVSYRPRSFYKEIKKIPNVKLIDPSINSFDIIKNSKLVTAITGTAGWEAVLLKKPVITFGDIFYNPLSSVKKCDTINKLPWLVKEQLENFVYNERELVGFIAKSLEQSATIDLLYLWERETDKTKIAQSLEPLAGIIASMASTNKSIIT